MTSDLQDPFALNFPEPNAPRVVVVGSCNTDLVVSVTRIPEPGETVLGGELRTVGGGKGANQAVASARMGAHVTFVGRVGTDTFGQNARTALQAEGIDTTYLRDTSNVASGVALIAVREETGENAIVVAPGANGFVTAADVENARSAFDQANAVIVSLEVPLEAAYRAVEMGHERRIPVVLNPAPAQVLPPDLLAKVALLTPNETEAALICKAAPTDTPEGLAQKLLALGVGAAVLTLGAAGALVVTPDGVETVPGFPVRAVDTVGAGDCFTATLAGEWARGKSLREAVTVANAAAAIAVTRTGAQTAMPTRADVERFLGH
jgi:ribokinase